VATSLSVSVQEFAVFDPAHLSIVAILAPAAVLAALSLAPRRERVPVRIRSRRTDRR
jgi:hypothetical protein